MDHLLDRSEKSWTSTLWQAAKAWAFMHGRKYVIPEDIQTLIAPVAGHRVRGAAEYADQSGEILIQDSLNSVDIV